VLEQNRNGQVVKRALIGKDGGMQSGTLLRWAEVYPKRFVDVVCHRKVWYGPALPELYALVDGTRQDSNAWHTKDGVDIAEKPDYLTGRGTAENALP